MVSYPNHRLPGPRDGFAPGYTAITREGDAGFGPGVDFGIQVMTASRDLDEKNVKEAVWVLLDGEADLVIDGGPVQRVCRRSLFDESPTALHVPGDTPVRIVPQVDRIEWAVIRASNPKSFAPRVFLPGELVPEYRGHGLAQETCLRNVRLIFDHETRSQSEIVIGEVINYPGRWSSYPPHHHLQPEIYHYRFDKPQGYGHGEVGDDVYRIRAFDTLRIPGLRDHAQVAAPGYAMYYLWIVRHLERRPYTGFEFTAEHEWLLDEKASVWEPGEGPFPDRRGHRTEKTS